MLKFPFFWPFLLHKVLWCFYMFCVASRLLWYLDKVGQQKVLVLLQSLLKRERMYLKCLQWNDEMQCTEEKILWWSFDCNYSGCWPGWWCRDWGLCCSWLRHYTKNLYLYNVSITASSTLCSLTPHQHKWEQSGAEKMLQPVLPPSSNITGRGKSYEVTLIRSKLANYKIWGRWERCIEWKSWRLELHFLSTEGLF